MLDLLKNKLINTGIGDRCLGLLLLLVICLPAPVQSRTNDLADDSPSVADKHRDFDHILRAGELRVLYHSRLPYSLSITATEQAMLEKFTREYDLALNWIPVENSWSLLPELAAGKGDIIVGQGRSIAGGMTGLARFTLPWVTSQQQVVARANTTRITSLDDLARRQVALKRSSPMWQVMQELAQNNPSMDLTIIPEALPQEIIMDRVASGQYDLAITVSDFLNGYLPRHPELSAVYDLTGGEPRAWAVGTPAENLQIALNHFLNKHHLEFNIAGVHLDDLPGIKERKILRLITYNNGVNYYFSGGRFYGFEYELIRKFARAQKMRVDVVLANSHEEMQHLLLSGKGDVIAASLPVNSIESGRIQFSVPYDFSAPLVIGRAGDKPILDVRDLAGRRIALVPESPFRLQLEKIRARGIDFELEIAAAGVDTETAISRVADGVYDLTVLDGNQFNRELAAQYRVQAHFPLSEPVPHGWAVRTGDVQLLGALNEFAKEEYRGKFYNALYAKYVERPYSTKQDKIIAHADQLSPYDDLVRKYAERYSFDWRLIVAQMYQESQFDPAAISHAGAEGLMQIMPATAAGIGVNDLADPATSIKTGIKYLGMLRDQFENDLLLEDRTWFSLASYNAGLGHVKKARAEAIKMGLDPNRWFGNVEKAMLALARPFEKDGEIVRNCRCGETVVYVHEIRTLYNNYVRLTQARQVARAGTSVRIPYDI